MKLFIEFMDSEIMALQEFAAEQVAGVDERSLIAAVRVLIRQRLIADGFLDRDVARSDLVEKGLAWMKGESILSVNINGTAPKGDKNTRQDKKGDKKAQQGLRVPQAQFKGKPAKLHRLWSECIRGCLNGKEPAWYSFDIRGMSRMTGLTAKQIDGHFRTLTARRWLVPNPKDATWVFSEEAKGWILKHQAELQSEGILAPLDPIE